MASSGGGRGGRSSTDDDSDEDEGEGGDGNQASQSDWVALTYNLVVRATVGSLINWYCLIAAW